MRRKNVQRWNRFCPERFLRIRATLGEQKVKMSSIYCSHRIHPRKKDEPPTFALISGLKDAPKILMLTLNFGAKRVSYKVKYGIQMFASTHTN